MKNNKFTFSMIRKTLFTLSVFVLFTSCEDKDDPNPINEEEVITTMNVTLKATGENTITLQSRDLDGNGPNAPKITVSGNLAANSTYSGTIELLNETESPAEDITEEVEEEDDEHQFFFVSTGPIKGIEYSDKDSEGNPLGISFKLNTDDAGSATLQITLRHEPKKPNDGSLSDAGGETDISQTFNLTIE